MWKGEEKWEKCGGCLIRNWRLCSSCGKLKEVPRSYFDQKLKDKHWNINTMNTYLSRLLEKGFLTCEKRGRMNFYRPAVTQEEYLAFESRSVLDRLYGSSVKRFVAALYQDKKMDEAQLRELEALLEELKGGNKMLEMLFANIVEITAPVSILILLLLALTPLLRRRYAAKWRYWVWFALAARLLIPLNLSLPKAPVQVQIPNRTCFPCRRPIPPHRFRRCSLPLGESRCRFSSCGVYAGDDHAIGGNDLAGRCGLVFAVAGGLLSVFLPGRCAGGADRQRIAGS